MGVVQGWGGGVKLVEAEVREEGRKKEGRRKGERERERERERKGGGGGGGELALLRRTNKYLHV